MKQFEKNNLSTSFDFLIQEWENACLVDSDVKTKIGIANEIIYFYENNSNRIHFLQKDFKLIEEIKFFLFLNNK